MARIPIKAKTMMQTVSASLRARCTILEQPVNLLLPKQENVVDDQLRDSCRIFDAVGKTEKCSPAAAKHCPARYSQMLSQYFKIVDKIRSCIVDQGPGRLALSATTLVDKYESPDAGIEKSPGAVTYAPARTSVQKDHRFAGSASVLLSCHGPSTWTFQTGSGCAKSFTERNPLLAGTTAGTVSFLALKRSCRRQHRNGQRHCRLPYFHYATPKFKRYAHSSYNSYCASSARSFWKYLRIGFIGDRPSAVNMPSNRQSARCSQLT